MPMSKIGVMLSRAGSGVRVERGRDYREDYCPAPQPVFHSSMEWMEFQEDRNNGG
jgi:hypothetical protein